MHASTLLLVTALLVNSIFSTRALPTPAFKVPSPAYSDVFAEMKPALAKRQPQDPWAMPDLNYAELADGANAWGTEDIEPSIADTFGLAAAAAKG